MTWSALLPWLPLLAWIPFAFGVLIIVGAFLSDRLRRTPDRRRCPRCWYDMRGIAGLTCPECGRAARHERALTRSRRNWRIAMLALPLLAAPYAAQAIPRTNDRGWIGALPTTALIATFPHWRHHPLSDPASTHARLTDELCLRITADARRRGIPAIPRRILAWLCLRDDEWINSSPGQHPTAKVLMCMLDENLLPVFAFGRICQAEVPTMIVTRARWPEGEPFYMALRRPKWLTASAAGRTITLAREDDAFSLALDERINQPFSRLRNPTTDPARLGHASSPLRITISLDQLAILAPANPPVAPPPKPRLAARLWRGQITLPITLVTSIDDVMQPVESNPIDTWQDFRFVIGLKHGAWITAVPHGLAADWVSKRRGFTWAAIVELHHRNTVIATGRLWLASSSSAGNTLYSRLDGKLTALRTINFDDDDWSLIIRSDPSAALRDLASNKYWSGAWTVPRHQITIERGN